MLRVETKDQIVKIVIMSVLATLMVALSAFGQFTGKLSFEGIPDGTIISSDQFVDTLRVRLESAGTLTVSSLDGVPCLTASGLNPIYVRFVGLDSQPTSTLIGSAVVVTEGSGGPNWNIGLRCLSASIGASGNNTQILPFNDYFTPASEELWFVAGSNVQGLREMTFVPIPEPTTNIMVFLGLTALFGGRLAFGHRHKF